jgi:hypothetical protein
MSTGHSAQTASGPPAETGSRRNDGVDYLVVRAFLDATDDDTRHRAAALAATAVLTGWLSWDDVASAVDGLLEDDDSLDGLTPEQAEAQFGPALSDVDDERFTALLEEVDAEAVEPSCAACGELLAMFHGLDGWRHVTAVPDRTGGWRRERREAAGHDPVPVWRYGPAARPAGEVVADPQAQDFDDAGRDRIATAGAALMAVVHDLDFHHVVDGGWEPFTQDPVARVAQVRGFIDRLRTAIADARGELDAVDRCARARSAHRQARQPAADPGGES